MAASSKIRKYHPDRAAHISHELIEKHRYKLGIYAQKLLFALAQNLDTTADLFPEWHINITDLFRYLNLSERNNDRYDIVRNAIREIGNNPIEYRISPKKWGAWWWLSRMQFDAENSNYVTIKFSDDARQFLLQLNQFATLETRYYIDLSSQYAMWLYTQFKNKYKMADGVWEVSLDRLRELTYTDQNPSYDPARNKNANSNFLKYVIGIESVGKGSERVWRERRDTNREGLEVPAGTLAEINLHTDLHVEAQPLKRGRSYDRIRFTIRLKAGLYKSSKQQEAEREQTVRRARVSGFHTISIAHAMEMARSAGLSLDEYLKLAGYTRHRNGKTAYKKI